MTPTPTNVWSALSVANAVAYGIPWIDPNTLQPNVDANQFAFLTGVGISVETAGDLSGTDAVNAGKQVDSFVPQGFAIGTVGAPPGFSFSSARGTRSAPTISLAGDPIGSVGGYAYLGDGVIVAKAYYELGSMRAYVGGVHATNPGGELRWGTKIDNGVYTEYLRLDSAGNLSPLIASTSKLGSASKGWAAFYLDYTNAIVTGAAVINKPAGSVLFAAAAQTLVVTNSLVTANSIIIPTVSGDDATAKSVVVSAQGAGSFTLKLNAAATAQLKVNFQVIGAD